MKATGLTYALLGEFLGTLAPPVVTMLNDRMGEFTAVRLSPQPPARVDVPINPTHSGMVFFDFPPGHARDQLVRLDDLTEAQRAFGFTREDVFEFLLNKWNK